MRYLLAGESHGPAQVGILEGFPAGVRLPAAAVDAELRRRLEGHGRGFRARRIEDDRARFLAGLQDGTTLGSPIAFVVENVDHKVRGDRPLQEWSAPRPGHADYAGMVRYGYAGCGPVAERASARATAGLTAAGACAKLLLAEFGVIVLSHVLAIGGVTAAAGGGDEDREPAEEALSAVREGTPLRCLDPDAEAAMVAAVDAAEAEGTTLGGVFEVVAYGLPVGLGTYAHPDRRLDAALAAEVMAVPSVKAVALGEALAVAARPGRDAHDEIFPPLTRRTNRAGGLEGGVTNGMPLRLRGWVKPIATQRDGLRSVDLVTGEAVRAGYVRSDTCVVPAAGVVAEAAVAWRLAAELVRDLGEAPLPELLRRARRLTGLRIPAAGGGEERGPDTGAGPAPAGERP